MWLRGDEPSGGYALGDLVYYPFILFPAGPAHLTQSGS